MAVMPVFICLYIDQKPLAEMPDLFVYIDQKQWLRCLIYLYVYQWGQPICVVMGKICRKMTD